MKINNKGFYSLVTIIFVLTIALFTAAGFSYYFFYRVPETPETIKSVVPNGQETPFQIFKSSRLGIELEAPEFINSGFSDCGLVDNPILISEETSKNVINFRLRYYVDKFSSVQGGVGGDFVSPNNGCLVIDTLESTSGKYLKLTEYFSLNYYSFKNRAELERIIQNLYGSECKLKDIVLSESGKYKIPELEISAEQTNCQFFQGKVYVNINLNENKILISPKSYTQGLFPNGNIIVDSYESEGNTLKIIKYYDLEIMERIKFY